MTNEMQNTPDVTEFGREAIKALVSGNKSLSKANALFTYVIAQSWNSLFTATIYKQRTDEIERTDSFDLSDIINETNVQKSDGKRDNKLTKARLDAVASALFDVDAFDVSQTNTFKQCLTVVSEIFKLEYAVDDIQLHDKHKTLGVPYQLMNDKPDEDDLNALRTYENNLDSVHYLDGKQGNSYAELKRRVMPKQQREQTKDKPKSDSAISFRNSVKLVADITNQLVSNDESDIALNADDERNMFTLYVKLGKYFDANKLDAKTVKQIQNAA